MEDKIRQSYENFLDPTILRPRIIECSLFITLFESLKDNIITRIKDFYATEFDSNGSRPNAEYQSAVLARNRSPVYASLDWLKEHRVIDQTDLDAFEILKGRRNELAHRLLEILGASGPPLDLREQFLSLIALYHKIEVWWIKNVEIAISPDFADQEVKDEDITPGTTMMIRLLMDVALGDETISNYYIEEWRKQFKKNAEGQEEEARLTEVRTL